MPFMTPPSIARAHALSRAQQWREWTDGARTILDQLPPSKAKLEAIADNEATRQWFEDLLRPPNPQPGVQRVVDTRPYQKPADVEATPDQWYTATRLLSLTSPLLLAGRVAMANRSAKKALHSFSTAVELATKVPVAMLPNPGDLKGKAESVGIIGVPRLLMALSPLGSAIQALPTSPAGILFNAFDNVSPTKVASALASGAKRVAAFAIPAWLLSVGLGLVVVAVGLRVLGIVGPGRVAKLLR